MHGYDYVETYLDNINICLELKSLIDSAVTIEFCFKINVALYIYKVIEAVNLFRHD